MRVSARMSVGAGLVALVVAAVWVLHDPRDVYAPPQGPEHDAARTPVHAVATGAHAALGMPDDIAAAAPDTVPRPAPGTPLPALWRELASAARAGHAPSACRLALETLRCAVAQPRTVPPIPPRDSRPPGELERLRDVVEDPTGDLTAIHRDTPAATLAMGERLRASVERYCGTPAPERHGEALALLRQAALAGVPDAQLIYASWGGGFFDLVPGTMADPTFDRWLEEAPTVLARMLDAGHPDAPRLLAEAHAGEGFLWMGFPYDPVRSVAYAQLQRRVEADPSAPVGLLAARRDALSPTQRAEADHLAERLYAEHYAGVARPARRDSRFMLGQLNADPGVPSADADAECAAPGPR